MSLTQPRISVVVPSFNHARFLRQTLNSILSQEYQNLELIVLDGGSKDGTVELLKEYSANLTFWSSAPDGGQFNAIKAGLKRVTGDIITYQNSDDYYLPGAFSSVAQAFAQFHQADLIYGNTLLVDEEGHELRHIKHVPASLKALYYSGFHCTSQSTFWTKRANAALLLSMEGQQFSYAMERFMYGAILAQGGGYCFLRKPLGCFRLHSDCKTSNMWQNPTVQRTAWEESTRIRAFAEQNGWIGSFSWPEFTYYQARKLYYLIKQGDFSEALGLFRKFGHVSKAKQSQHFSLL